MATKAVPNCHSATDIRSLSNTFQADKPVFQQLATKHPLRESAIVTKLNGTSGVVRCCNRDASLFFFMKDVAGCGSSSLHVGDFVEFELFYDPSNGGRPTARNVIKKASAANRDIVSEHRLKGNIVRLAKDNVSGSETECWGEIVFEFAGEYYCLPYHSNDCDSPSLSNHDQVSFHVANRPNNGFARAVKVQLENASRTLYKGVVCALKNTYGYIERADNCDEVFFHFSQIKNPVKQFSIGDPVEFNIEMANSGKDLVGHFATNVTLLPAGSIMLETVLPATVRGTILRTLKGNHMQKEMLGPKGQLYGCVVTEPVLGVCIQYQFGQRDLLGDFTLFPGDVVIFNVAIDRRNDKERATNIQLLPETFTAHEETRHQGRISAISGPDFGFIRCAETLEKVFFRFSETMDPLWNPDHGCEAEFSLLLPENAPANLPIQAKGCSVAIRIRPLLKGTVSFKTATQSPSVGVVVRTPNNCSLTASNAVGLISCFNRSPNGSTLVEYEPDAICDSKQAPRVGETVEFHTIPSPVIGKEIVVNVVVVDGCENADSMLQGFVATLKDSFGFIETAQHDHEIFFHCTSFMGDFAKLSIGDEVSYVAVRKNGRMAAYNVTPLPRGTVNPEIVHEGNVYLGVVVRPLRLVNPEQENYAGLVQLLKRKGHEGGDSVNFNSSEIYEYGVTGLADPCDYLQTGDRVSFKLATVCATGQLRATCVTGLRQAQRARVHCVKYGYGFLDCDVPSSSSSSPSPKSTSPASGSSGRKLFFHMSEVQNHDQLKPGDLVEYYLIQNQQNGRYAACSVRKVPSSSPGPKMSNRDD